MFLASCTETFSHALPTQSPLPSFLTYPSVGLWRRDRNIQIQRTVGLISYFPTSRDLCVCVCLSVIMCVWHPVRLGVVLVHLRPDVLLLSFERSCTATAKKCSIELLFRLTLWVLQAKDISIRIVEQELCNNSAQFFIVITPMQVNKHCQCILLCGFLYPYPHTHTKQRLVSNM